jgi:hypothetical protein
VPRAPRARTLAHVLGLVGLLLLTPAPGLMLVARADSPAWMTGCWTGTRDGETFTERWFVADAATLIGTSHTVKAGVLSAFEFLRVVQKGEVAVYVAQPQGAPPTEFTATAQTTSDITFVNPTHDFPKRIGYRRLDATHLTAWIDGGEGGKGPRLEFAMTRTRCEP